MLSKLEGAMTLLKTIFKARIEKNTILKKIKLIIKNILFYHK